MTTYNLQQHNGPVPGILEFQTPMCPGGGAPNAACEEQKRQAAYDAYEAAQRAHAREALSTLEAFQAATAPPNDVPGSPAYAIALSTYHEALAAAVEDFADTINDIKADYAQGVLEECCGE